MAIRNREVLDAIDRLARTPVLLISTDYDGTIAPIVSNPAEAHVDHNAFVALRTLAELPATHVGIISGRSLAQLHGFLPQSDRVHLVGSHGSEFDAGFATGLGRDQLGLLQRLEAELTTIASAAHGLLVEVKPAGVCLHTRSAAPSDAKEANRRVMDGPATWAGVYPRHGKRVIELTVVKAHKGDALQVLRGRLGATMCVFLGDDRTDEDVFETLVPPDVSIKIGPGRTAARLRLGDQTEVAPFMAALAEARGAWLAGGAPTPIEHHAMLSDHRTIALLTPTARLTWLCAPRVDSPALFADLLGGPEAGYWSIQPANGDSQPTQRYLDDTLTVETAWPTLRVTDFLDCSGHRVAHQAGRLDLVRMVDASGPVRLEFAPRLNFGRTPTSLRESADGLVVGGGNDLVALRSPGVRWTIETHGQHQSAVAIAQPQDRPLVLELRYGTQNTGPQSLDAQRRQRQTEQHWASWAGTLLLPEEHADPVRRSALLLKGLVYGPTGAIAAAGTMGLPEWIGGVRNWDYRYCWPRDASMAALALVRLGSIAEAMHLLEWLRGVIERVSNPDSLAPLYTVTGQEAPQEGEISELSGYAGSRPVRVGNAAALQLQLDVYGPIVDLVAALAQAGAPLSMWHWNLVERMAEAVLKRWREPDHGIWEPRIPPRHHVHTKAMCWLTLQRAAAVASTQLAEPTPGGPADRYRTAAEEIRQDVLDRGWNDHVGAFTGAYDSPHVDAAALCVGLSGMVDPRDERFVRTVGVVERTLGARGHVYRYEDADGLPGAEGAFNLCTAWLVESLVAIGQRDRAAELFKQYLALAGPTGMMAEEVDPATGRALGNVPQAYSHLGLINAALSLGATP
jgi:trehalose-phosphatase